MTFEEHVINADLTERKRERAEESTVEFTDTCATIVKHYVIKTEVLLQNWISRSSDSQAHPY